MKESRILWVFVTAVLLVILTYSILNRPTYKVTFDSNGGTEVKGQDIIKNDLVTKPEEPVREGYIFKDWIYDGTSYDFNSQVTSNMKIEAAWEAEPTTTTKKTKKTTTKKTTTKKPTTKKKASN